MAARLLSVLPNSFVTVKASRHKAAVSNLFLSPSLCSEKPLSLQIFLTDRQGDQSAATQDQQATSPPPCLVSNTRAPTSLPREDRGPCLHVGKPFSNTGPTPALGVDTWEPSHLGDLAPPPPAEEADCSPQWTRTSPVSIPAQAPPPPPRSYSPTPSPANRCRPMVSEEQSFTRPPQITSPVSSPTSTLAPPPPPHPTRNWSCLTLDLPDVVDSPAPPVYSPSDSPSIAPLPPASRTCQPPSPPPNQDYRAALPVERWAENVNRYYGSQSAIGLGGGAAAPGEELSELDSLYQASLLAPSMPRGSRGVSPQPTVKPGTEISKRVMFLLLQVTEHSVTPAG